METLFVGKNIIFLPEVESTNSYATELLKNVNVEEGSVVHTANQTRGKGQRGNMWNTEPHSNLTASIIIKPAFLELKRQFFLYKIAALASYDVMAELLDSSQFDIKIKWPNDILVDRKKIGGILIENVVVNNRIEHSVVGIGINVLQCEFDEKLHATSIQLLSGKRCEPSQVLKLLCSKFEKYYLLLKSGQREKITEMYAQKLFAMNEWQEFESGNNVKKMKVRGTGETGLLMLEEESGNLKEFDVKEIRWII
jgi:BirA family biotin operon repressor/biotin-[acetyl-CoA-carboxylase] ligase